MALIRYSNFFDMSTLSNPFQEMARLRREMDRLFTEAMGKGSAGLGSGVFPALNVSEDTDNVYVLAELPGIKPEALDISVERNTLTLSGERKADNVENVCYHRQERRAGTFHKAVTLPYEINAEAVEAEFKDGVLRLMLPKTEHAKPKRIEVRME